MIHNHWCRSDLWLEPQLSSDNRHQWSSAFGKVNQLSSASLAMAGVDQTLNEAVNWWFLWAWTLLDGIFASPNLLGSHGDSEMSYGMLWDVLVYSSLLSWLPTAKPGSREVYQTVRTQTRRQPIFEHEASGLPPTGCGHGWKPTTLDKDPQHWTK